MRRMWIPLLLCLGCACISGAMDEHPLLPADTSSPRATLNSFMENCDLAYNLLTVEGRDSNNEEALARSRQTIRNVMRCMDLSGFAEFRRENAGKEAAVTLKEVLDRIELPPEGRIPDLKAMTSADGSLIERWTIPNTEITFQLIKEGAFANTYQFSSDTVERSKEFYLRVKHLPYKPGATENFAASYLTSPGSHWLAVLVKRLPESWRTRAGGQAVWQWIGIVIVLLAGAIIMSIIYFIGRRVSRGGAEGGLLKYVLGLAFPIMAVFVPIHAQNIITRQLVVSGSTLYILKFNLSLITLFAAMIVVLGIGRRAGEVIVTAPHIARHTIDAQLIRIMSRLMGFMFAMVLLLQGGQHLGIPLSSLLAGAGVIGMALALSAQDVLKNVFGSIMLILDKPFTVGERVTLKGYDGVVEEIGLRSTKIRLLNGHQASIPNEEMARTDIENIGRRPFIRRVSEIPLAIDIPSARAQKSVEIVKEILQDHEGMKPNFPPRVWLDDFKRDHMNLKMIYWYHPPNYWDYTAHADFINRQILDAFEAESIRIAVPALTIQEEMVKEPASEKEEQPPV